MREAALLLSGLLFLVSCQTQPTGDYAIERESLHGPCYLPNNGSKKSQFSGHPPVKGFSVPTSTQ